MVFLIQTRQMKSSRLFDSRDPIISQTTIEKPSSHQTNKLHPSIQPKHHVEYLVFNRHGHYINALNSSSSDTEQILSKIGKQQARLTAKHLASTFGATAKRQDVSIHHSDMTRAVETAPIISRSFADCTVQVSSLLREGWPGSPFQQKTTKSQKPATYRSDNDLERMYEAISRYLHSSSEEHEE
uniref:Serine/threonine-protein phosphatase PGAM5, mitochondrial n=1 Tax=Albugo laibachii Nc14 TaxID=890382 RepID=F0W2C7_9STRA|nr:conserved hypothetical protein [Albugo laibachii Nc14]|eukprot:CCA15212.1 conserved hypothetical protein [Albugo laibachii Nc14]